jgi:hypothetical protein
MNLQAPNDRHPAARNFASGLVFGLDGKIEMVAPGCTSCPREHGRVLARSASVWSKEGFQPVLTA